MLKAKDIKGGDTLIPLKTKRKFSFDEMMDITLEFENAALYAHSHKLSRQELKKQFTEIRDKHNLHSFSQYKIKK